MNNVSIIGRITKDPELRQTPAGDSVVSFSIAVDEGYGEKKKANFFEITAWKKTAENVAKYVKKGNKIGITGSLKQSTWEKDGTKHSKVSINAFNVEFLESKPKNTGEESTPASTETASWDDEEN